MAIVPLPQAAALTALTAELLLLLRLALSDDKLGEREVEVMRRFATGPFGFEEDDIDALLSTVLAFGEEMDIAEARAAFREGGHDRNLILARLFFDMVGDDPDLAPRLGRLGIRVADILALDPDELAGFAGRPADPDPV